MNPVMSSEAIRLIHDSMLRDQQARRRQSPGGGFRHIVAVVLVGIGDRLDPSVRPTLPAPSVPAGRLRAA
jgi:hypothetical protein